MFQSHTDMLYKDRRVKGWVAGKGSGRRKERKLGLTRQDLGGQRATATSGGDLAGAQSRGVSVNNRNRNQISVLLKPPG